MKTVLRLGLVCVTTLVVGGAVGLAGQAPGASGGFETVATLPSAGATENICQGADGAVYVTAIDEKVVWKICPGGQVEKFATLPAVAVEHRAGWCQRHQVPWRLGVRERDRPQCDLPHPGRPERTSEGRPAEVRRGVPPGRLRHHTQRHDLRVERNDALQGRARRHG